MVRSVPYVAAAALALRAAAEMHVSPHIENVWILEKGETAELRKSHDFLVYFRGVDFFPFELRQTADYLRAHTRDGDRVQTYGMDPYVLFLAERRSATPFIYAYDLNADVALTGGFSLKPTWEQTLRIRALRDEHERELLAKIAESPPAAFVFFDKSPLITLEDAYRDFAEQCPEASAWVEAHYVETARFGPQRVWLRRDRAAPDEAGAR
jgi:hypothetical protein